MGAQRVRRLLLAAAAGALLASGAAADIYSYDSYWTYQLPSNYHIDPFVSADNSGVVIPVYYHLGSIAVHVVYCFRFSGSGVKLKEYQIWNNEEPIEPPQTWARGLITYEGDVITAYDINDASMLFSALFRRGIVNWTLWEWDMGLFQVLGRPLDESYFYNYRFYSGAMRACKCRSDSTVISYFTPSGGVDDIAVASESDGATNVYVAYGAFVNKYSESGSLLQSWPVPSGIKDLTVDRWQRLLALAQDKYTYVYSTRGVLLGSFTANYATEIYSADVGPGNQYFVMGYPTSNDNLIYVYRFTPDTTGVIPTSLGKIKAIYY